MSWEERAACRGVGPVVFFPPKPKGRPGPEATAEVLAIGRAKAVCARCPVADECLEDHLGEKLGVWGNTNENERRVMRSERRRKRARMGTGGT